MSVAAPELKPPLARPDRAPARRLAPRRTHRPAARPPRPSPPFRAERARRRSSLAFWVLTALVVTVLVVGVVSLSALLVRASFRVEEVRRSIGALQAEQARLATEVVTLSAPSRIAEWGRVNGMVRADDVQVLRVRLGART